MPRKRPKTAADRPVYRPSAPMDVPQALEPFLDGLALRQIVERYGLHNLQLALDRIAEEHRRELVERRSQEIRDAWKTNTRPLAPIRIPHVSVMRTARESRSASGYRGHREEGLDSLIRKQARARELEDGLAVISDRGVHPEKRAQLVQIVDRANAGESASEIAAALNVSVRTVEGRLAELREAAVVHEELESAS